MKKLLLALTLLLVLSLGSVFASGTQEQGVVPDGGFPGDYQDELVELTG